MNRRRLPRLMCICASVLLLSGLLPLLTGTALADAIDPGFDLFSTPPGGGVLDFSPFGGPAAVPLVGRPIGPGNTDTIVQRHTGLPDGGTGLIEAEIVALSLESVNPVPIMGSFFDVFVELSAAGAPSLGVVNVTSHGPTGGTFDSFFDVFTEVTLTEVGNPSNQIRMPRQDQITSQGSIWSHMRPPHYPMDPAYPPGGFFPGPINHTGPHPHTDPSTPEPSSVVLIGIALASLLGTRRRG